MHDTTSRIGLFQKISAIVLGVFLVCTAVLFYFKIFRYQRWWALPVYAIMAFYPLVILVLAFVILTVLKHKHH